MKTIMSLIVALLFMGGQAFAEEGTTHLKKKSTANQQTSLSSPFRASLRASTAAFALSRLQPTGCVVIHALIWRVLPESFSFQV